MILKKAQNYAYKFLHSNQTYFTKTCLLVYSYVNTVHTV